MADFDSELLQEMADNAPQAGYGPNVNFGKLTVIPTIISWKETGETFTDDSGKEKKVRVVQERPLKKGDKADTGKGEYIRLKFMVNIQEFNPGLEWSYERDVDMKVSGPRAKTNWSEIVLPSLIATFGDDWSKKIVKSPYVSVEDADDFNGTVSKKSGKILSCPKFIAVYRNRSECEKAWRDKYSKKSESSDGAIPDEVIGQVKGLVTAVGNNIEQAVEMLNNKPFGNYDPKELLKAAGFKVEE